MSDKVLIARELLEFIVANARGVERERMDELRALLTAQPQASADDSRKLSDVGNELHNLSCEVVHSNEDWAEQIGKIACELWKWPQASAAQSAPAGEREALQRLLDDVRDVRNADDVVFGWDEAAEYFGAAWQRTQSAGVAGVFIVPIQPTEEMRKRAQDYLAAEGMIVSDWLVHTVYTEMLAAAPAQPAAQDHGEVQKLREALTRLLSYAERQICTHEETHRGGAIWEICDMCGDMWADDKGGKPEFKWPAEIEAAREILADVSSEELKPCPFCGFHPSASADDCIYPVTADRKVWSLNCYETGGGCGAAVLGGSPEECIALWNTRTSHG